METKSPEKTGAIPGRRERTVCENLTPFGARRGTTKETAVPE